MFDRFGPLDWALRSSRAVSDDLKIRVKFILAALRHPNAARALAKPNQSLAKQLAEEPQTAGFLLWPYQCSSWDADERVRRIQNHFDAVAKIPGLQLALDEKLVLADLSKFRDGLLLVLDRPPWLSREGHLTLSIFDGKFRAFTISFSIHEDSEREIFIGGIQGRNVPDILSVYRDLTKALHGVRPRDFLVDCLRLLGGVLGATRIRAVADRHRIGRHKYFNIAKFDSDYDLIWTERGGELDSPTFYILPSSVSRRPVEEIAQKKRQMYRRRYEMYDEIEAHLPKDLRDAKIVEFEAT